MSIPAVKTQCGYACSDHASFGKAGYQSAFAYVSPSDAFYRAAVGRVLTRARIESSFEDSNHGIHSTGDTIDHPEFSFSHMKE